MKAWEKTDQESLRLTGRPLRPLFSAHDATSRMTISQLLGHLKSKGVIQLPTVSPLLENCLNRGPLVHYWESLSNCH